MAVPLLVLAPVAFALAGLLAALVLARGDVHPRALPLPVAAARARGLRWSAGAVAAGLLVGAALVATGVELAAPGLVLAAVPAAAAGHAAVALHGELSWPRPTGRVRGAGLTARSVRHSTPPVLTVAALLGTSVVLLTCTGGLVVTDGWTSTYLWTTPNSSSSADPFPGAAVAVPVLIATALCVAATCAVLGRIPGRPAVPCADPAVDAALRRAAGHRVLRITASALLGTAGVLVVLWHHAVGLYGTRYDATGTPSPGPFAGLESATVTTGFVLVLLGLVVLAVPARGLRAPAEAVLA
ncbi:hypothetical protein [Kineococcus sp. SYSU DK002]|uniref:hypothetical protein n=1 Tax=Kineococcus sp. SYSU DK002 TaxID=3383123 RepID=UPI003D7C72F5